MRLNLNHKLLTFNQKIFKHSIIIEIISKKLKLRNWQSNLKNFFNRQLSLKQEIVIQNNQTGNQIWNKKQPLWQWRIICDLLFFLWKELLIYKQEILCKFFWILQILLDSTSPFGFCKFFWILQIFLNFANPFESCKFFWILQILWISKFRTFFEKNQSYFLKTI